MHTWKECVFRWRPGWKLSRGVDCLADLRSQARVLGQAKLREHVGVHVIVGEPYAVNEQHRPYAYLHSEPSWMDEGARGKSPIQQWHGPAAALVVLVYFLACAHRPADLVRVISYELVGCPNHIIGLEEPAERRRCRCRSGLVLQPLKRLTQQAHQLTAKFPSQGADLEPCLPPRPGHQPPEPGQCLGEL